LTKRIRFVSVLLSNISKEVAMKNSDRQAVPPQRRRNLAAVGTVLVLLAAIPGVGCPQEPVSPPRPPITIVLKGGAGIILVDRTWAAGSDLCWESRGFQGCVPQKRVSYVHDPSLPTIKAVKGF
jgi:hypothetical protein